MIWNRLKSLKKIENKKNNKQRSSQGTHNINYCTQIRGFEMKYRPKLRWYSYSFILPDNTEVQCLISNN